MVGRIVWLVLLACVLATSPALAAWLPNGVPASTAALNQAYPPAMADGYGGVYVAWYQQPGLATLYYQHFDQFGHADGPMNGVLVGDLNVESNRPPVLVDGPLGTAYIVWSQSVSPGVSYIRVQHLSGGAVLWAPGGVLASTNVTVQNGPSAVADGAGGLIIGWADLRNVTHSDIYAQRIDTGGNRLWAAGGVPVCTRGGSQLRPALVSDGANGAIMTWLDFRLPQDGAYIGDIYAQRILDNGSPAWTLNGVAVCTAFGTQDMPAIVIDQNGGAIISWTDHRDNPGGDSAEFDLYLQRLNASGATQWTANGIRLNPVSKKGDPDFDWRGSMVSDGAGGVIVCYTDNPVGSRTIRAHRLDPAGNSLWGLGGVNLTSGPYAESNPFQIMCTGDGAGGAVIAWMEYGNGANSIYAMRVDKYGVAPWTHNGVPVCNVPPTGALFHAYAFATSDGNSAFVTWGDGRNGFGGSAIDVYVQRLELAHGAAGRPEPSMFSAYDVAGDQGGFVALDWWASDRDLPANNGISHYSVWRSTSESFPPGAPVMNAAAARLDTPGRVVTKFADSAEFFWELVGTQPAVGNEGYSMAAPTRADAIPDGPDNGHSFRVLAHDAGDEQVTYASATIYGSSVDNLAPSAPVLLTGQRVGDDVLLKWKRAGKQTDLKEYAIYRGTSTGVTPDPINFVSSPLDTAYTDADAPSGTLYYIVTARDVHLNQSAPSNEAVVSGATGVSGATPPAALSILTNVPNPFSSSTELRIGMPATGAVTLDVFDVAGRRVARRDIARMERGWQRIVFDARDSAGSLLPAGVYFYKVSANGQTRTRKMVITR